MKTSTALYIVLAIVVLVAIAGLSLYVGYGEEFFMTEILGYEKVETITELVPVTDVVFNISEITF